MADQNNLTVFWILNIIKYDIELVLLIMKNSDFYPLYFCLLGTTQLCLVYGKSEFIKDAPYMLIYSPTMIYLAIELLYSIYILIRSDDMSSNAALAHLVHFATLGLALTSLTLYIESLDSEFDSIGPALIPLFIILVLHSSCRVLQEPPPLLAPILNVLAPAMTVCTINGTCSSMYISIFSSIFSAFGASLADLVAILHPLTYLLLFLTALSLYYAKHSVKYPPFILGVISSILILVGQLYNIFIIVLISNAMLVASVLWNNKVLKQIALKGV
ncbi:unnamed protein product [Blepharisma stoltei]|uniref:Uncharacterized protein n=1 Tax=Blepharisma stoltei TaxID=1481888 RepID=A0AAU9IS89_9CILI|nr:unnamed protein product [Blepharisma stoltei]